MLRERRRRHVVRLNTELEKFLAYRAKIFRLKKGTYISALVEETLIKIGEDEDYSVPIVFESFFSKKTSNNPNTSSQISIFLSQKADHIFFHLMDATGYHQKSDMMTAVILSSDDGQMFLNNGACDPRYYFHL